MKNTLSKGKFKNNTLFSKIKFPQSNIETTPKKKELNLEISKDIHNINKVFPNGTSSTVSGLTSNNTTTLNTRNNTDLNAIKTNNYKIEATLPVDSLSKNNEVNLDT